MAMTSCRFLAPFGASAGYLASRWLSPDCQSYAQCKEPDSVNPLKTTSGLQTMRELNTRSAGEAKTPQMYAGSSLSLLMGRYDRHAAKMWRAESPGVVVNRTTPSTTQVIRIVLTGGPCAGKSSCLTHLRDSATEAGYDVYLVPEVATVFLTHGVQFPSKADDIFNFQAQILGLQLAMERTFIKVAARTGRPSIIIYDRGLLDGKSYVTDETWQKLMEVTEASEPGFEKPRQHITEQYMFKRYDCVVHLVTAADGAEEFYHWGATIDDSGNKVFRGESPDRARELDSNLRLAWNKHPNHVICQNGPGGFKGKMEECTTAILDVANRLQPQPKFLKERVAALEKETVELKRLLQNHQKTA